MNIRKFIPENVSRTAGRLMLKTQANSPTILFGVGVVGVVSGTVLACRATLKVEDILDDTNDKLEKIKTLQHDDYSEKDRSKDRATVLVQSSISMVRLYGPSVILMSASIACLTKSHDMLNKRNAALAAAYTGLEKAYEAYRERVREVVGEDEERAIYTPTSKVEIKDAETGEKTVMHGVDGRSGSPYARIFDEANSTQWSKDYPYNKVQVQVAQNYANDLLRSRGHVFLNEVYNMLGLSHTKEGAVVGWLLNGEGDGYIDFGVFDNNEFDAMRFVMGDERSIWLDFNVDGIIYNKI